MKTRALPLLLTLTTFAHAQFYAPDTEFHDIAQRTFAVEAARVFAWQRNLAGAQLAEVKFAVQTTPARETVWTLRWLDAEGKPLREKTVRYPESLLLEGPKYFREVLRQIASDDWKIEGAPPDNAAAAFWQGAGLAGASRLEAVQAAGKLLEEQKTTRAATCARLAGMLVHGAVPMISNSMSLDSVLLARGAAWLCLAEAISREPFDEAWAPLHFLAGRERLAGKLWIDLPAKTAEKRTAAERFWDHQLRAPSTAACFVFAAKSENRAFALPAMMYPHHFDPRWTELLVESADELLDAGWKARLYEYAPNISIRGGWSARQFTEGAANRALSAWLRALQDFRGEPADETSYRAALAAIDPAGTERIPDFAKLAPLLNPGADQSRAPLIPVAHVTARDLLGYGWEQIALQFGSLHRELADGDEATATQLEESALTHLAGVEALFPKAKFAAKHPLPDVRRLQFVNSSPVRNALRDRALEWRKPPDLMFRRRWLAGSGNREFETMLLSAATEDELRATVARLRQEGGPSAFHGLIEIDKDMKYPGMIDRLGLRLELANEIPWAVTFRELAVKMAFWQKDDPLGHAQTLEQFGWESGVFGGGASEVIANYLDAGAVAAAKRFAGQVQPFLRKPGFVADEVLYPRFALAWWERDEAGMASAVAASDPRSGDGIMLRAMHALLQGKDEAAAKTLGPARDEPPEERDDAGALAAWLPLAPALRDPLHADHQQAIDAFPRTHPRLLFLQWALGVEAKLPVEERARLLASPRNRGSELLIAAARGEKDRFARKFAEATYHMWMPGRIIASQLRRELLGIAERNDAPDLKPADARPAMEIIRAALAQRKSGRNDAPLEAASFNSADEAWAAVEALREFKPARVNSPEDQMRLYREWLGRRHAAAEAFDKAYPGDPRHWDAQLLAFDSAAQLAEFGARPGKPPEKSALEAVLAAPDASADAKGEAAFILTTMAGAEFDPDSPHTLPPFHRALSDYLEKYPQHRRAPHIAMMQLQLLQALETPGADTILAKLAAHPNAEIAAQAKAVAERRSRFAELKKKPLTLKLTASDGTVIDFAKLRGKVVLLDFWATWCGPCLAEAPNLVATYEKLRERGFTIVGVSLDEDRAEMEAAVKKLRLTWPQHFDGKGWQNEIAQQFAIHALPAAWLFDKKGMLRATGVRGEELQAAVERLLAE